MSLDESNETFYQLKLKSMTCSHNIFYFSVLKNFFNPCYPSQYMLSHYAIFSYHWKRTEKVDTPKQRKGKILRMVPSNGQNDFWTGWTKRRLILTLSYHIRAKENIYWTWPFSDFFYSKPWNGVMPVKQRKSPSPPLKIVCLLVFISSLEC